MSPLLNTTTWTPLGPAPLETAGGLGAISGRVQAAAPDPSDAKVLYVGGDNGGIWKNVAPGGWVPLTDFQPSLNFSGYHPLVVHRADAKLVLGVVSGAGAGLLKSSDAGATWQRLAVQFDSQTMPAIAVHPTDTALMYISAGWAGVWKSTDGGMTWQQLTGLPAGFVSDLILAKFDWNTLYAGVVAISGANESKNGVYRSTDGGTTWQLLSGLPSGADLNDGSTAIRLESGTKSGVVYTAILPLSPNPSPPPARTILSVQRFRTTDGGTTWKPLKPSPGNPETRSWHLLIAVDPNDDDHIFANDAYSLYENTQGGMKPWSEADTGIGWLSSINHFDWVNLSFDVNGDAVLTADQGAFRYALKSKTWTSLIHDLQVSEFYTITIDPKDSSILYAVGQDIFTEKTTGSLHWNVMEKSIGETGKVLVDPTNSSRLCGFNPLDTANFVKRSSDGGATWKTIFPPALLSSTFLAWYAQSAGYNFAYGAQLSFAMDLTNPHRLIVGADRIFETKNAMAASPTWSAISGVLSSDASRPYFTTLAIAESNPGTVYAPTPDGHVWVTHDNGAHWATCDAGITGTVQDLRVDPSDENHVFAVTDKDAFELLPSTLVWEKKTNLPAFLNLNTIFVDWRPAVSDLFVGTSRGVYRSVNLGATWAKFSADLPNTDINDLQGRVSDHDHLLRIVVAGTYGRGAWGILVPPWGAVATAIVNGGNFGTSCVSTFADQLLTINNIGPGPLTVTGITTSDADFQPPSVAAFPLVVGPGDAIDVIIRFAPKSYGAKSALLTITSDDPSGPHTIKLSGVCGAPKLNLAIADAGSFGATCVGSFKDEPLVLNNSGSCTLSINGIASATPEFVVPHVFSFPLSVAPGTSLTVPIRFVPSGFGATSGSITVTSDDPAGPRTIAVSGVAPSGVLAVTGSTCFGGVRACTGAERTLSICNVGDCDLHVTSVAFKRKSRYWKLLNSPFPATLHPGSCLGVVIRYWAAERCPRACQLLIESDDPTTPVRELDMLAYTMWNDCGCGCDECRKGCGCKSSGQCCTCCDDCCGDEPDDGD